MKKAILVVSFGTSYEETRKKTIDRIETDIREAYPDYTLYRAWTSKMIRKKLLKRDGIEIPDVCGAMKAMACDGIQEVVIQPTHVINGYENDLMKEEAASMAGNFEKVCIGAPLLNSHEDNTMVVQTICTEICPQQDEAVVLMGHGSEHFSNTVYAALDYQFKDSGHPQFFMGTVEGYPSLDSVISIVKKSGLKKVALTPFMIVAGDHAQNDLAGDEPDSWKSVFEREGFAVRCLLKGLGEYDAIRGIFLRHIRDAIAGR